MDKLRVGVLFGGRSGEHEVSLVSAASVIDALDAEKYEIIPIGITRDGRWLAGTGAHEALMEGGDARLDLERYILPESGRGELTAPRPFVKPLPVDVIFPVLHGPFGEDGTIQGLLELASIPYVGAGVLGSAVGMDKDVQKRLLREAGIPVAPFLAVRASAVRKDRSSVLASIEKNIGYPCFVKPANLGSSVGISKARTSDDLEPALMHALEFDVKVVIEQAVSNAREIECAVLGSENPLPSIPGEVIASNEFYDYDAKYVDGKSELRIPAPLDDDTTQHVRGLAVDVFTCLECDGMARVDFLLDAESGELFVNEINTIPGFTSISMYPKLFDAVGIPYPELIDRLIELALARAERRHHLRTDYQPPRQWHKDRHG